MLFSSTIFLFMFLPAVLLGYYLVFRKVTWRNYFRLLMSLLFYAWGEPVLLILLLTSVFANWVLGLGIAKGKGRKLGKSMHLIAVFFAENHAEGIRLAEFKHHLTAHAAGSEKVFCFSVFTADNRNSLKFPLALTYSLEKCCSLGTDSGGI